MNHGTSKTLTLLCVLTLSIAACGFNPVATATKAPLAPPPTLPSVTAPAVEAAKEAQASDVPLVKVERAVNAMPASDLRTQALAGLAELRQWWSNNLAKWNAMVLQAQAQDSVAKAINKAVSDRDADSAAKQKQIDAANAKIAKLEAGDPNASKVLWASITVFGLAGTMLFFGIWIGIPQLKIGAFIMGVAGVVLLLLYRFIRALDGLKDWQVLLGGAVIAAILGFIWWMLHRKVMPTVLAARDALASLDGTVPSPPTASAAAPTGGALAKGGA